MEIVPEHQLYCADCADTPTKNKVIGTAIMYESTSGSTAESMIASRFGVTPDQVQHMFASLSDRTHNCIIPRSQQLRQQLEREVSTNHADDTAAGTPRSTDILGRAHILDLPMELIEWVTEYLPTVDLMALRLSCRELSAKVSKPYERAFFTDRTFIISDRRSMNILRNISSHRVYSRTMKHVRFARYVVRRPEDERRCLASRYSRKGEGQTRLDRMRRRDYRRAIQQMAIEEDDFCSNAEDVEYLFKALVNFMKVQNYPAISWASGGENREYLTICKRMIRLLGSESCMYQEDGKWSYHTLFMAVAETMFPLVELQLGSPWAGMSLKSLAYPFTQGTFSQVRSFYLTLDLEDYNDTESKHFELTKTGKGYKISTPIDGFIRLLADMYNLESLSLICDVTGKRRGSHRDIFLALTSLKTDSTSQKVSLQGENLLPKLQYVELVGHTITPETLLVFTRDRKETLKIVKLRHVRDGEHDYPAIEDRIREAMGRVDDDGFSVDIKHSYDGPLWLEDSALSGGFYDLDEYEDRW